MIIYVTVPSSGFSSTTQETNKLYALIQGKFKFLSKKILLYVYLVDFLQPQQKNLSRH